MGRELVLISSLANGLQQLTLLDQPAALQEMLQRASERVAAFFPPVVAGDLEKVYDKAREVVQ